MNDCVFTGSPEDLHELWKLFICTEDGKLYSLYRYEAFREVNNAEAALSEEVTIDFGAWDSDWDRADLINSEDEYYLTLDQAKEKFPQWAEQIERGLLLSLL